MDEIKEYIEKMFEDIKHTDDNKDEYWEVRELQLVLKYKRWDKFLNVINRVKVAFSNSSYNINELGQKLKEIK